jgi:ABC transporter substrate binding protein (PQQ-dependent alcohol dehydrogenase system)
MLNSARALIAAVLLSSPALAADPVRVGWLAMDPAEAAMRAFVDGAAPGDEGLAGLRLAIADNNATGRFLKQSFAVHEARLPPDGDAAAAMAHMAETGIRFVVADLPAPVLARVAADPRAAQLVIFNAGSDEDSLRNGQCRRNLLHTLPSRAMRADSLAQVLVRKNWRKWLLIEGPTAEDAAYADAIRRAARKFGAKLMAEKRWTFTRDPQRSAEGEVAALTQGGSYDVVVVADEANVFGDEVPYATWEPRPVAGSHGLVATGWHPAHEQWGAIQLHHRFRAQSGRPMEPKDFAAWQAGRAVGEAAQKARSADPNAIIATLRAEDFTLAAFKGRGLSFRPWDGQLRQPMLVAWARAIVAVAPQEGFLHPLTDLDTLGTDKGESTCAFR